MKFCPNFSIPSVRTEFESLSSVVGEDFAYFVWNKHQGKSVETDNPLFNNLLDIYAGNRQKAIFASSIVYSYKFKRQFPDFKNLSVKEQAQTIENFFNESKESLEKLAQRTIATVSRVHRAETVRKVGLSIDRRQAKIVAENVENSTEAVADKPTAREILDAYHKFKQSPLSKHIPFRNLQRVVNGGAFAQWTRSAITLFQGSDFTDLYHESWHEFSQGYFNLAERTALWSDVKNRLGSVKIGGVETPYYNLTGRQADEILAEEYRDYALARGRRERESIPEKPEEKKSFLERVFDRIYNFFKALFGGESLVSRETPLQNTALQKIFSDLYEGKLDAYKYDPANYSDSVLNRSKELELTSVSEEGEVLPQVIPAMEMAEIFEGIDYYFLQAMTQRGLTYSFLNNPELKKKYLPEIYNDIKVYFETYYSQLLDASETANEAEADQIENRIDTLTWILSSSEVGDNWQKVIDHHKSFSKGNVLADSKTEKDNSPEQESLDRQDESEATRDLKINKNDAAVDTELLMFPTVLELVKNLPNVVSVNGIPQPVYSRLLGLPTTSDYLKNKNLLLNRLSGVRSYAEVLDIIRQNIEVSPQLAYLLEQLPPAEGVLTPEQFTLKQQFIQSFTLPTTVPFSVKLEEDLENPNPKNPILKTTTYQENTLSVNSLIEQFDQEFSDNANRMFRNADLEGIGAPTFNVQAALAYLASKKSEVANDQQMFDFYKNVFGIDLLRFEDPSRLFNREGNVINGASQLFTGPNLKALRGVASHAFRKMRLFVNVAKAEDLPKYVKNLVSIENISNPMAYFTTDISTKLSKAILSLPDDNIVKKSFKKDFPFTSIHNQRRVAFNAIELVYNVSNSGSFLTLAGTMEYSIGEWNAIHSAAEQLNSVENIADLSGRLSMANNKFIQFSAWMNKMFAEDGSRNTTLAGEPVEVEVLNFSGFQAGSLDGQKTTNLTADDKFIQDLLSFLKSGVFENLRFGGKAFAYATKLRGNQKEVNYYDKEQFQEAVANGKMIGAGFSTQMQKYLYFEGVRMFEGMNGKQDKKNKRASDFILFHDILKDSKIRNEIKDVVKASKSADEVVKNIRGLFKQDGGAFRFKFEQQLDNWFSQEVDNHVQIMNNILADGNTDEFLRLFKQIVPNPTAYTVKDVQAIMAYYISNYFTHQVEVLQLMVSDQSNFNFKSVGNVKEIFKRLGPSATPGRQPIIDSQDLLTNNSDKNPNRKRLLEFEHTGKARDYDGNYNYVVFKDVSHFASDKYETDVLKNDIIKNYAAYLAETKGRKKANAKDIEEATKLLSDSLDTTFTQKEESNAQAGCTLDFARHYLDSIGEWMPEHEEAYLHEAEVFKAVKQYRKNETPENLNKVKALIEQSNKGIFVSLKLGHHSNAVNNPNYTILGKFSVLPLIPSAVFNTDHEDRLYTMLESGTDLYTFESGNKMAHPAEYIDFYKEGFDNLQMAAIPSEAVVALPMSGLRRQQYIAPKFKNSSTLSSQLVKLAFANFYEDGEFSPRLAAIPGLKERIDAAQEAFIKNLEVIVEAEKAKIFLNIGANIDAEGKLVSLDVNKYKKWLTREFDKKDLSPVIYDYLHTNNNNEFTLSLDASPQRSVIEGTISSAINKRVIKPKLFGEAYVQVASTGFQTRGKRFNKLNKNNIDATIKKYGLTGVLRDYRVENGKSQPADIALSFNPTKHAPLMQLEYNGVKIGDTEFPLDTLNQALLDDAWVEEHSDKITLVGVRIPVQKFNSFEHFRIRRFLPTSSGPVIVVPPSIVTKSGSDFDIDKLFMYEPEMDANGELMHAESVTLSLVRKNEIMNTMIQRLEMLTEKKRLKEALKGDYANFVLFQTKLLGKDQRIVKETIESFKQLLDDVKSDKESLTTQISDLKFRLSVINNLRSKYKRENPALFNILSEISDLNNILAELEIYNPQAYKRMATNNLVKTLSDVLSEPALFPYLIEPNDSLTLKRLAAEYDQLRSAINDVTGTSMFLPRISNLVYSNNTLAAKSLGIDAKVNALHKLYQQVGLRFTDPTLTGLYQIKANKAADGSIILGGFRDADQDKLISDIINEFINGHVDVEKEDWINYFNADPDRTAVILQMILSGTPIEDALMLVNQPVVQHYISSNRTNKIKAALKIKKPKLSDYYKELLAPLGKKPIFDMGRFDELATIQMLFEDSLIKDQIKLFNDLDKSNLTNDIAPVSVEVSKTKFNQIKADVTRGDLSQVSNLAMQVALFTQFRIASLQNEQLLNLTRSIDFNTSSYRNVQDFYRVQSAIEDARGYFNNDAIDKIINSSVVSPFNVTTDVLTLFNNTFDIIANPQIQSMLSDFQQVYGKFWSTDRKVTETNNLLNAIIHGLIQRYGLDGTTDFYQKYGPKSDHLTTKKEGNLISRFQTLKNITDPTVKKFLSKNLFFQDLSHRTIPNSGLTYKVTDGTNEKITYDKFIFRSKSNDKHSDTVATFQAYFLQGLNFNESTPENNELVTSFFRDLAYATIGGQGFTISYRSIHPYLPVAALPVAGAIDKIKQLKSIYAEINSSNLTRFDEFEDFKQFLGSIVSEFSIPFDRLRRNKFTPYKRYFPDFIREKTFKKTGEVVGIEISSNVRGLGAALTNPTESSRLKENISKEVNIQAEYGKKFKTLYRYAKGSIVSVKITPDTIASYPIVYKGKLFADVEAAYQANKNPYLVTKTTQTLMKELIKIKLENYPDLVKKVDELGGVEFLEKSTHNVKGDAFWESKGENMFVKVLTEAYQEVIAENPEILEESDDIIISEDSGPAYDMDPETGILYEIEPSDMPTIPRASLPFKKKGLFQLRPENTDTIEGNIEELDSYLTNFVEKFGVRVEEFESLKERLGVDALGFTDLVNKLIWVTEDRKSNTLPEEAAHVLVMMMGPKHPAILELLGTIQEWDKYTDIKEKYLPIYNSEYQVEIEAVGQLIAEALVNNYKVNGIQDTFLKRVFNTIKDFIKKLFNDKNFVKEKNRLESLANKIASEVLKGNYDYIADVKVSGEKLNYQKAVSQNPFAKSIIDTFTAVNAKLTGSLALAGQGDTVYRPSYEPIHDLDFIVYSKLDFISIKSVLENLKAIPVHNGIEVSGSEKICHTYMIPASGFKIQNIERQFKTNSFQIKNFDLVDKDGNLVEPNAQNLLAVDFFTGGNEAVTAKVKNSLFAPSQDIYAGKLTLSSFGVNERFFKRAKDQKDYVLSRPSNYQSPSSAFTYYQLGPNASAESDNLLEVDVEDCNS